MIKNLGEIKEYRKRLNLTQKELAEKAGVSQSYITKIEAGIIEPTYNHARKILGVLENIHTNEQEKAKDFMNKKIITLNPENKIGKAIEIMKKHSISQIPIIKQNKILGIISETSIVNNINKNLSTTKISEVMENSPPIIPEESNKEMVIELLRIYPLLLVAKKGKLSGIITKTDLFKKIK
jgi:predicted transcriptional regulator